MRYLLLGHAEVRDGDTAVPLSGARLRALITALALHPGRAVPQDELIAEVWADDPPADAPGALQALVGRLRRALGREAVTSEPAGGYRLVARPESVDLFEFEALLREGEAALGRDAAAEARTTLTRALALWRGPALADMPDDTGRRTAAAARPEALRLAALRLRIEADLALGRAADALPALREAVADHPLDEAFRVQLIRALRAAGRTADALVAYEEARTVLAETLGADPGPELRALHAELLRLEPVPEPVPAPAPPPTAPRSGNLRARLTSFVGREAELDAIRADLGATRLVTLTGPGGSGKTRLAQEAADRADTADHPDGVWLAELAPLDDPAAIPHAVLSALGRRDTFVLTPTSYSVEDPLARLLEHCASRRLLLVLDNCEHLIGAAAALTAELLAQCPGVTVLATSREPLGVPGEVVRPVEPLPPLTAYRLFEERAAAVRGGADAQGPGGRRADHDEAAVREICRRLDGLPLAIELAAARLRALSPRQIADRLDDRFRLLTGGSRTLLPRQQTLRAVVDWSWDLLDERERDTLRALSVFAGGCTLPAAEAVCGADALDTVAQLVDKSLVIADHGRPGGTRYRLLETIHEYAAERLAEHPQEAAAASARHTAYHRDLARTADPQLRGADQMHWLDVLETEVDNIRAALHRAIAAGCEDDAIRMALAMGWFWWIRNYRDEASGMLDRVLALGGGPPQDDTDPMYWPRMDLRLLDFFVKSDLDAQEQWFSSQGRETADLLIGVYGKGGPPAARFPGLLWPFTAYLHGGSAEMRRHTDAVVANCRIHGGDWELAAALMFRTHVTVDSPGGLERADADRAELRRLTPRLGDRWVRAQLHGASAEIETLRCNYAQALADYEAALALSRELGAVSEGAFLLGRMADLAYRAGDDEAARTLCAQAEEEAERYSVWDARTYIRYLKAVFLLERGEVSEARAMCELTAGHIADGTPPPMFQVLVAALAARITAAEGDLRGALAGLAEAARTAEEVGCTDPVLAAQFDTAADLLLSLGDPAAAVRLSAASTEVRGALPRTVREAAAQAALRREAARLLGPAGLSAAEAAVRGADRPGAVALLTELAARLPADVGTGAAADEL
ncbi:BTAD domain-containing putative transcriptional regulator [Streptomyces sp. V4-01]|uniref:BTAD domain-containing putative transcriptional regulator n=1 Tax=Actinacidiphila polyblastidii TaxID=3110430 RepID=A0ABU7PLI0_9ACTN|nr:BTAD domain-containing putative transcriptional regulator [Streptomyces sp. V4-01]